MRALDDPRRDRFAASSCSRPRPRRLRPSTGTFPTPDFDGSNTKIAAGPDGNMWLPVNEGGNDVARIGPDGTVTPFKLGPEIEDALGIAAGPEGRMWVTATNKVGSFAPSDPEGTIDVDTVTSVTSNSPIVAGPDGQMWAAAEQRVVHFSPSAPDKAEAFPVAGLQPKDIDVAGSLLVVADSAAPRIVTMTTAGTSRTTRSGTSTRSSKCRKASLAGRGRQARAGRSPSRSPGRAPRSLGLIEPARRARGRSRGTATRSGSPSAPTGPTGSPLSAGEAVQRLTRGRERPPSSTACRRNSSRARSRPGPNNTIWVTMEIPGENIYEVARISGLEPPVKPGGDGKPPATARPRRRSTRARRKKCTIKGKAKRAWAKFRFSSTTAGATFECALTKKPAKKGKKTPKPNSRPANRRAT